jgi:ferredoxin
MNGGKMQGRGETSEREWRRSMRAKVDQLKCRTVGECVKTCPDVFRFQEGSKRATVLLDPIPPQFEKKVRQAARRCPENAVIVEE